MCRGARIVEGRKDAWWASFLNQVTDNLVVEVLDRRPFDLFSDILFLLRLERQLDENLLQFLIDVVDAKLFK